MRHSFFSINLWIICFIFPSNLWAQTDTASLEEVVVTGIRAGHTKNTSLNIEHYSLPDLQQSIPLNLSDALAHLPGVNQMSTGNAISKPVIRGLYGHRILTLLSGLRFDNQQWQDEHGLGLSQIGLESVELIRGPASILYGTDAMGGVINIIEEKPKEEGTYLNANTRFFTNTLGTLTDVGILHLHQSKWWRFRGGYESHSDYSDGNNTRVLNSRNTGYYAKAGWGFNKPYWVQNNAYNFSYNQYGFIMDTLKYFAPDARFSRKFIGPHHNVLFNTFSSQNTFTLPKSVLKINAGIQSNKRAEDEGGGEISLNMHLLSLLENAKWEKQLSTYTLLVLNQQFTFENNTNLGKRKLIPDANMLEGNYSAFIHYQLEKADVELGVGINHKNIQTFKTKNLNDGNINNPDSSIYPFNQSRITGNALIGFSFHPNEHFLLKTNLATGNRMANLAELSSNGLHEGTQHYEIGNPNLKMEQNFCSDITTEINNRKWFVNASVYYNRFLNYIYLAPTNQLYQGLYYEYRFQQQNATIYGGEIMGEWKILSWLHWKETVSVTKGVLDVALDSGNNNLPFIAPVKWVSSFRFEKEISKQLKGFYLMPEAEYIGAQNHPSLSEFSTKSVLLFNVHAGAIVPLKNHDMRIDIACKNLTNQLYMDYLSRLKNYGIYNTGINFVLSLSTNLKLQ